MKTQSLNPKIVQSLKSYWRKPATHQVLHYAMSPSGIPAHHVFGYLNLWERTRILKEELSIRFAHQVRNLVRLPYGMPHLRDIKEATDLHIESFDEISNFPQPYSDEDVKRFVDHIEEVNSGHLNMETELMNGLQGLFEDPFVEPEEVNEWMDSFFLTRISIQTLIMQHTAMVRQKPSIVRNCNVSGVVRKVINDVTSFASDVYSDVPEIEMTSTPNNIVTPYISSYLHYVITELLKNSIVAHVTSERSETPVEVRVVDGETATTIKISDQGAGFPIDKLPQMMYFGFSSDPVEICEEIELAGLPIFSGFGYGLPMARLYIKYLGGSLRILPVENLGADVYVYIPKTKALTESF